MSFLFKDILKRAAVDAPISDSEKNAIAAAASDVHTSRAIESLVMKRGVDTDHGVDPIILATKQAMPDILKLVALFGGK